MKIKNLLLLVLGVIFLGASTSLMATEQDVDFFRDPVKGIPVIGEKPTNVKDEPMIDMEEVDAVDDLESSINAQIALSEENTKGRSPAVTKEVASEPARKIATEDIEEANADDEIEEVTTIEEKKSSGWFAKIYDMAKEAKAKIRLKLKEKAAEVKDENKEEVAEAKEEDKEEVAEAKEEDKEEVAEAKEEDKEEVAEAKEEDKEEVAEAKEEDKEEVAEAKEETEIDESINELVEGAVAAGSAIAEGATSLANTSGPNQDLLDAYCAQKIELAETKEKINTIKSDLKDVLAKFESDEDKDEEVEKDDEKSLLEQFILSQMVGKPNMNQQNNPYEMQMAMMNSMMQMMNSNFNFLLKSQEAMAARFQRPTNMGMPLANQRFLVGPDMGYSEFGGSYYDSDVARRRYYAPRESWWNEANSFGQFRNNPNLYQDSGFQFSQTMRGPAS